MYMGTYHRLGLPVTASDRQVIRALRRRMTADSKRRPELREARHKAYRLVLDCHRSAKNLAKAFGL